MGVYVHKVGNKQLKLPSCLIKHHAMKMYHRIKAQLREFLTLALDRDEWVFLLPGRFNPGEKSSQFPLGTPDRAES
jgi:hypothetical protein